MNPLIQVILLAMAPISELRGAIPLGIMVYHLNPILVTIVSMIFNLIPAIFVILFFDAIMPWIKKKFPKLGNLIEKFSQKRQQKHRQKIERYGLWAIMAFVAIPFPLTGAWTGSLLSVLFEMPRLKSMLAISGGIVISGCIVLSITLASL
ncbi:COG2426 family protein [Mesoaciditoga sp.]